MSTYTISIKIAGELAKSFSASIKGAQAGLKALNSKGKQLAATGLKAVTGGIAAAGAAAAGMAVASAKEFGEVDKSLKLVQSTMGATDSEAKGLEGAIKTAAANSVFGMQDAADATLNFARQGFNAAQAANMISPALNLAAGTATDLSTITGGLGNALKMFGLNSDYASTAADILSKAQAQANTTVTDLFEAMSTAGPMLASVGWNMKDLSVMTDVFGNAGISGSEGATALKTGLARLASPAKEGATWMERLGLQIFDASGQMKPMLEVQAQLHDAFSLLTSEQQVQAASAIFGKNQMAKWMTLINAAPSQLNKFAAGLDTAGGSAQKMADSLLGGLGGSVEKMKSSLDVFKYSLGSALSDTFQPFVDGATKMIDRLRIAVDNAGVGGLVTELGFVAADAATSLAAAAPQFIQVGTEIMSSLLSGLSQNSGAIASGMANFATNLADGLLKILPQAITFGADFVSQFAAGVAQNLPALTAAAGQAVSTLTEAAQDRLGMAPAQLGVGLAAAVATMHMPDIASGLTNAKGALGGITKAVSGQMRGMGQAVMTFPEALTGASEKVKDFGAGVALRFMDAQTKIGKFASEAGIGLVSVGDKMGAFGGKLGGVFDKVAGIGAKVTGPLSSAFGGISSVISSVFAPAALAGVVVAGLGFVHEAFGSQIDAMLQTAQTKGPQLITNLANGIAQGLPALIASGSQMIVGLLNTITANAPALISGGVQIVGQLVVGIAQNLPSILAAGVQMIASVLMGIAQNIPQIIQFGMEAVGDFAAGIIENLPKIIEAGLQLILALGKGIVQGIPKLLGEIPKLVGKIGTAIKNAITGKGGESGEAATNEMSESLTSGTAKAFSAFGKGFSGLSTSMQPALSSMGTTLGNGLNTSLVAPMQQNFGNMNEAVRGGLSRMHTTAQTGAVSIAQPFQQLGTSMQTATSQVSTGMTQLQSATGQSAEGVAAMKSAVTQLNAAVSLLGQHIQTTIARVTALRTAFQTIGSSTAAAVSGMQTAGASILAAVQVSGAGILAVITATAARAVALTAAAMAAVVAAVRSGMARLVAAVSAGGAAAAGAAMAAAAGIRSAFSGMDLYSQGYNAMAGLRNGIAAAGSQAIAAARNVANQVKSAVNTSLKIGSPSRELMQTGIWADQGLAIGMRKAAPQVRAAATESLALPVRETLRVPDFSTPSAIHEVANGVGAAAPREGGGTYEVHFAPVYHFGGDTPTKDTIVQANRLSQAEFDKMFRAYMRGRSRVSFA